VSRRCRRSAAALVLAACAEPTLLESRPVAPPVELVVPRTEITHRLDPAALLSRVSLDLRGVRPTVAELDLIEADPEQLDTFVDAWLHDPRFGERLADLFDDVWSTRTGNYYPHFDVLEAEMGLTNDELVGHFAEEPLRMLSWIAEHDLPYDTFVTADWSMADEVLGAVNPVDYPPGVVGWRQVHYTDGRPAVGVLATNDLWWLHGSMANNLNRNRANTVARALLCDDFLEREVPALDGELVGSPEGLADAIRTDPACVSCHETLDPLASHFYGYWWYDAAAVAPRVYTVYHPEREGLWRELTGVPPGYFGKPSRGLVDLGHLVAADPRFPRCFVEESWELLTRTDSDVVPVDLEPLARVFEEHGRQIRPLFRAVVHDPAYQGDDERFARKRVSPSLLSSQIRDLTGYSWTSAASGRDLLESPDGYPLLAGGFDRDSVQTPAQTETVTSVLVEQRLADAAAGFALEHDRLATADRVLFALVDFSETPEGAGRDRMVAQIRFLHRRLFGRTIAADGPEVAADLAYWSAVRDAVGVGGAAPWAALLSLLLRDPDLVTY
jgi:hypothetical protein